MTEATRSTSQGDEPAPEDGPIDAGPFSSWLAHVGRAIEDGEASDVPCGACTACCTSSQFVHIAPDETATLARVPSELTFPAPGLPPGHVLLGYDEHGRCPMLVDGACSIYADRPRTCRTYDCRVFPATGLAPDGEDKAAIAQRSGRWRFTVASDADHARLGAVRAAARFLHDHVDDLADLAPPTSPTQRAVLAIEIHGAFLAARRSDDDDDGSDDSAPTSDGRGDEITQVEPDVAAVRVEIRRAMAPPEPGRRARR